MSADFIPFNKPYLTGKEVEYIREAVMRGHISGNGYFTKKCHSFFERMFAPSKCLLTTSCTDALEMCAILIDIKPGDEVIMPSYTFVSTANAFVLRGARIIFADSQPGHPNLDTNLLEPLITPRTKAIVPVHYGGVACDMEPILHLAEKYNLYIIEDAAQAIESYYKERPLGTIGHLGTLSFHETKNVIAGEGGLLIINDKRFEKRAEIIWEKGTNRAAFFKGEVDKYGWVDIGSSFLPSDIIAAFLYAQVENMGSIQQRRNDIWNTYYKELKDLEVSGKIKLPVIPHFATNNAHLFYIRCNDGATRDKLIAFLKNRNILSVFHYLSLHKSPYYSHMHDQGRELKNADAFSDELLRLPLFVELTPANQQRIIKGIHDFFYQKS